VTPALPSLDGIVTTPYLDRDGNLIAEDGYHPGTRLLLQSGGFKIPPVSATPDAEDVAQAVKLLTEDWLGDFPFASPADRANVIAVPLTMTGRMFFNLVPLFVFDASTAGSGKGLLATTISLIKTGEPPQVMELPADGEEQRKKITSALLAGHELIMWDESHVIQGRTLAAILTAEKYSDRLLGGNKLISVTNRFTQVALGNNVEVWGDMKRRVVPARLVPDTEHPEHRADFRHPDLEGWALERRGDLLAAVLTIWRNWIAKGRPEADAGMGSFERWSRTVGGALKAAGIEGFRSNTANWLSDSDDDDGWHDHLRQLRARWSDGWFTTAQVAEAVDAGYLKRPPIKRDPDKELADLIGYAYRKARERWHGDVRLVRSETRDSASGGRTWSVVQCRSETPDQSSGSSGSSGTADHADHPDDEKRDPERCIACDRPPRRGCHTCWDHAPLEPAQ
jgi:DNA polymerase-1